MSIDRESVDLLPPGVRCAAFMIDWELTKGGRNTVPRLIDVTVPPPGDDLGFVRFVFEISSGMSIALGWYQTAAHYERAEHREEAVEGICRKACDVVEGRLQDLPSFKSVRTCAMDLVADAKGRGLPVRLIDVRLTETGEYGENIETLVEIETLAHNLRNRRTSFTAYEKGILELKFSHEMGLLRGFVDERARLMSNDADGTIDLLALNILRMSGRIDEDLRFLMDNLKSCHEGGDEMFWDAGKIRSRSKGYGDVHWNGNDLRIEDRVLPDALCACLVGRPITDLIAAPAFSSEIKIGSAKTWPDEGLTFTRVLLDLPDFFFNVDRRQIWPARS